MKISGQFTEEDFVRAQRLHFRPNRVVAIAGILFLLLFTSAAYWTEFELCSLPTILAYVAFLPIYFGLIQPFLAKRNFRSYKALSEPIVFEIRENGLFFKRTNAEGLIPWSEVIKWKKNQKLILLYPTKRVCHLIPAHFFKNENDFQSFSNQIETKIGNPK